MCSQCNLVKVERPNVQSMGLLHSMDLFKFLFYIFIVDVLWGTWWRRTDEWRYTYLVSQRNTNRPLFMAAKKCWPKVTTASRFHILDCELYLSLLDKIFVLFTFHQHSKCIPHDIESWEQHKEGEEERADRVSKFPFWLLASMCVQGLGVRNNYAKGWTLHM